MQRLSAKPGLGKVVREWVSLGGRRYRLVAMHLAGEFGEPSCFVEAMTADMMGAEKWDLLDGDDRYDATDALLLCLAQEAPRDE